MYADIGCGAHKISSHEDEFKAYGAMDALMDKCADENG